MSDGRQSTDGQSMDNTMTDDSRKVNGHATMVGGRSMDGQRSTVNDGLWTVSTVVVSCRSGLEMDSYADYSLLILPYVTV
jgi:hypothetical protein